MFYRKRPVLIDAKEWVSGAEAASNVIDWVLRNGGVARYHEGVWVPSGPRAEDTVWVEEHLEIDTLEGIMTAQRGDFIIRGVQGEFYPCKPDIFHQTYERL